MVNFAESYTQIQKQRNLWIPFVSAVKDFVKREKVLQQTISSFPETELCWGDSATRNDEELIKNKSFISFADTN